MIIYYIIRIDSFCIIKFLITHQIYELEGSMLQRNAGDDGPSGLPNISKRRNT